MTGVDHSEHPTTWTVDVDALGRAVTVPVPADRPPSRELLDALEDEDRRVVMAAHAR